MIETLDNIMQPSQGIQDIVTSVVSMTESIIGELSEYERGIIKTSMLILQQEPPSTKLLITTKLSGVVRVKSDMQYLILRIKDIRRSYNIPYTKTYNRLYTLGSKKGLPSKLAIESDMFSRSVDLADARDKINDIDMLLDFFDKQLALLDSTISILESRKYDV